MAVVPRRIAMWSGPRNLSTALMRSFGNREDTIVVDEPFYAHYLAATGLAHPMREEILRSQPTDWRIVVEQLRRPLPPGKHLQFEKQMAHHLLPGMGRDWFGEATHAFLIRDPRPMLESLAAKLETCTLADTGLPQQVEIYDRVLSASGRVPAVIDAADLLAAPEPVLRALCTRLGIGFTGRMLEWPSGPRDTDGVWGRHWYDRVERTTRFETGDAAPLAQVRAGCRAGTEREEGGALVAPLAQIEEQCRPLYEKLRAQRLAS